MLLGEPMERIALDITGPHPRSRKGNIFVLTVLDHFTKFALAIPLRNHEAHTVASALIEMVFSLVGLAIQILTDQVKEFESRLMAELCCLLGIDKIRCSPYKPSTNGALSR